MSEEFRIPNVRREWNTQVEYRMSEENPKPNVEYRMSNTECRMSNLACHLATILYTQLNAYTQLNFNTQLNSNTQLNWGGEGLTSDFWAKIVLVECLESSN